MENVSRRNFVLSITLVGGALAVSPTLAMADDAPKIYWAKIGAAKDYPVNVPTLGRYPMEFGAGYVYVKRVDDKNATALSARCVHHGCKVNFVAADNDFVCPCHHAQYSASGEHLGGPGHGNLAVLLAKIDNGEVWVQSLTAPISPAG